MKSRIERFVLLGALLFTKSWIEASLELRPLEQIYFLLISENFAKLTQKQTRLPGLFSNNICSTCWMKMLVLPSFQQRRSWRQGKLVSSIIQDARKQKLWSDAAILKEEASFEDFGTMLTSKLHCQMDTKVSLVFLPPVQRNYCYTYHNGSTEVCSYD